MFSLIVPSLQSTSAVTFEGNSPALPMYRRVNCTASEKSITIETLELLSDR